MAEHLPRVAVILAGGLGTRLRPLTWHLPKGLLPVANRPLLSYELEWLARAGVEQVILAVAEQAEAIEAGLGHECRGMELVYRRESARLDTAGALKNAAGEVGESFWALNGDLIFDFEPAPLVRRHRESGAALTLALRRVEEIAAYGLVRRDESGRVTAFLEKQATDPTGENLVNFGVYLIEPMTLEGVPAGQKYSNERQLFPELVASGATVVGFLPEDIVYWSDVGRLETYLQANHDLLAGALPWLEPEIAATALVGAGAGILSPCALGDQAVIGAGAVLGPYVSVGAQAVIGSGARIVRSVILPGATIGSQAHLEEVVVASGEVVPDGHYQQGGVVSHE
ncbi:MAG: NDP-sugar synthase [candidate division WS1 bacterium]|jgi:NDP-sugar pyrophosphorylase family protein|nr:NDP-sugar synthase [candidate division WS1 bacterium]